MKNYSFFGTLGELLVRVPRELVRQRLRPRGRKGTVRMQKSERVQTQNGKSRT